MQPARKQGGPVSDPDETVRSVDRTTALSDEYLITARATSAMLGSYQI